MRIALALAVATIVALLPGPVVAGALEAAIEAAGNYEADLVEPDTKDVEIR